MPASTMDSKRWMTAEEREAVILEHVGQVRAIARRIQERLPQSVHLDDLVSAGILGLISAIDSYDPSHRTKLSTYADYRIRGAILDSLRSQDWAPRSTRRQSRAIESAIEALEQRLQRTPNEDEIATELGMTIDQYRDALNDIQGLEIASVDSTHGDQADSTLLRYIADDESKIPSTITERAEMERILADAIEQMPVIERTVLGLYYQGELSPAEIARVVGLKAPRVSQIRCQAIARLRSRLKRKLDIKGL